VSFLGHAQSGQWGEMSVDNATTVMQQCPDVKILYLNKTDFLSAMDQLTDRETEDAVLYRLQRWSPNANSELEFEIYKRVRAGLNTLVFNAAKDPDTQNRIAAMVNAELVTLAGDNRIDGISNKDFLESIIQRQATIHNEYLSAAEQAKSFKDKKSEDSFRNEADYHASQTLKLAGIYKKLYNPDFSDQTVSQAGILRTYYISPLDQETVKGMQFDGIPIAIWRQGYVAPVPEHHKDLFEHSSLDIVYLNSAQFSIDMDYLTKVQLDKKLTRQIAITSDRDYSAYRNRVMELFFELILQKINFQGQFGEASYITIIDESISENLQKLFNLFSERLTWKLDLADNKPSSYNTTIRRHAGLYKQIAQCGKFPELAAKFESIAQRKK